MKLTNTLRDAFVRAVMDDVPKTDYSELIRKEVQSDAVAQLPAKIAAIYKDKDLKGYIRTDNEWVDGQYVYVPTMGRYKQSETCKTKTKEYEAAKNEQDDKLSDLRSKIRGCAYACTTRKALAEMLPEFEKYLPEDEKAAIRTLPVVANVVSDFVKAGWPKPQKKAT